MNLILDRLLDIVKEDPLPEKHTSSHWKLCGEKTIVRREGERLVLNSCFGDEGDRKWHRHLLSCLTRLSYRSVVAPLKYFPYVWESSKRLVRILNVCLGFNHFKNAVALSIIKEHCDEHSLFPNTFALIGDGGGFFGALVREYFPNARIYFIDLPKCLVFQVRTQEVVARECTHTQMQLFDGKNNKPSQVNFVLPGAIETVESIIDFAVNISSMQEMKYSSIESYFNFLRRRSQAHSRFYCVNRLKTILPQGEIIEFQKYPFQAKDTVFIDGICPYMTHFLSWRKALNAYGQSTSGPNFFGVRVPFVNYFDGKTMHRLVHLCRCL